MANKTLIVQLLDAVEQLNRNVRLPQVDEFETIAPILGDITMLVATLDLNRLTKVPDRLLDFVKDQIHHANECITEFIVPSFPLDQAVAHGVVRPIKLRREPANINSWRGQLENVHRELYQAIGPIVAQQQARLSALMSAVPVQVERGRSLAPSEKTSARLALHAAS